MSVLIPLLVPPIDITQKSDVDEEEEEEEEEEKETKPAYSVLALKDFVEGRFVLDKNYVIPLFTCFCKKYFAPTISVTTEPHPDCVGDKQYPILVTVSAFNKTKVIE